MKRFLFVLPALLSGCAEPLAEYTPVVDPSRSGANYQNDLAQCRAIASQAEAEYNTQMANQMVAGMIIGGLVGAAAGNAYGGSYGNEGAAWGAAVGAAATDTELAYGGPRRIIDRCLEGRGHTVLNDLGKG